eukprot:s1558_g10.t1
MKVSPAATTQEHEARLVVAILIVTSIGSSSSNNNNQDRPLSQQDEDVARERRRVSESDTDVVRLLKLRKVYRTPEGHPKVAVHSLSFGLPKGECFGFLGINGAARNRVEAVFFPPLCRLGACHAEEGMQGRDGWDEPDERDMPNVPHHPDHGSGEEGEGPQHVAVVSDTHVLKEVYQENIRYRDKISKMIRDYDLRFGGKAAEIQAALKVDPNTFTGRRLVLHRWISWWGFDTLIGVVILANSVVIGFESQVRAEMPLGCTGDCDCENQLDRTLTCNKIPLWIILTDYGFYAVYLTELILRLGVYGVFVLKSHWVKFDAFLVTASTVDIVVNLVSKSEFLKQVMLVRLLRLARLARALRLMVQFQTLWQLVQGLFHSIGTIMWTFLLVTLLMYIYAVTGMELIRVEPDLALDHPYNVAAGGSFRDLMDAILTLLQVFSMDSIGSIYRPLIKQNTICFIYFFLALLILSIALMNLVTAVMVNSSLDRASEDKEAKKAWEAAKRAKQMDKLKEMFLELDEDGSGELSLDAPLLP